MAYSREEETMLLLGKKSNAEVKGNLFIFQGYICRKMNSKGGGSKFPPPLLSLPFFSLPISASAALYHSTALFPFPAVYPL
jgi:hypothetical protein